MRSLLGTLALAGALATLAACDSVTDSPSTSAPVGAITVDQLLARSSDTPIAVQGFLLEDDRGVVRLCAAILESYPPQCGEPSVELVGLDIATISGTTTAEGITWKEGVVLTLARAQDGRFTVAVDGG